MLSKLNISIRGEYYALFAAILNGSIGSLNRLGFDAGITYQQFAFLKSFIAFLILFTIVMANKKARIEFFILGQMWKQLALLAFLGIFSLYFFETWAFDKASIPLVAFLLYATGFMTVILAVIFLKEKITVKKILAILFIFMGIYYLMAYEANLSGSLFGASLAILAGFGYALFIFFAKVFKIPSTIGALVYLFGFGSIFLFIPYYIEGAFLPPISSFIYILLMVLLPTIGGFYCTLMALKRTSATNVQMIETSDPVFASVLGVIIFADMMSFYGWLGASFVFLGLIYLIILEKKTI